MLAKGGEGGGKSVFGIVKDLNRLRAGMNGILVSPDLPHFKKSLWPEFRRWCPPEAVVEKDRYRLSETWEAQHGFELHFYNMLGGISTLYCGGIEEPGSWEGPNVNFAHFDEARRAKRPAALKVLDGRIRITGPSGESPQLWLTTTPELGRGWIYRYFGPIDTSAGGEFEEFKRNALVITLLTRDNSANLDPEYERNRRNSLTKEEADVLLEAQWSAGAAGLVYGTFGEENLTDDEPDLELPFEIAFDDGYIDPRAILFIQRTGTRILVFDELYHRRHLEEVCVEEAVERCGERFGWRWLDEGGQDVEEPDDAAGALAKGWSRRAKRLPEIAVGSHEATQLHRRFRKADIPSRHALHPIVEGIRLVRSLVCDGNEYRTIRVNRRCRNLISEMAEGYVYPDAESSKRDNEQPIDENNHACDALRMWAWLRSKG
jgi:hypothetical protein